MNADQQIAEWLTEDARFDDDAASESALDDASDSPGPEPEERALPDVDAKGSRGPEPRRPGVAVQRVRRIPAAFGFSGPEARILELLEVIGRRIRRRPLSAIALTAAAGFVLGGAMSFRAGRLLVAAGVRHVTRELLKQVL